MHPVSCTNTHHDHSHKKQHSLGTCVQLLFMLLQDFLLVPDSTESTKNFFTEMCSTLFVPPKIK